ncbi:hypothetical protein D3C78_1484240 [compost metagenome]
MWGYRLDQPSQNALWLWGLQCLQLNTLRHDFNSQKHRYIGCLCLAKTLPEFFFTFGVSGQHLYRQPQ